MADLSTSVAGIRSPNPFWLASGPPTNSRDQVLRAFDYGWGGAVWKTVGEPIINVSARLGAVRYHEHRMMGLNNIELITDRPIEVNLREIAEVKKRYPKHAVIASLMVESKRETWHEAVKRTNDSGADGIELNFGCPHGMSERGTIRVQTGHDGDQVWVEIADSGPGIPPEAQARIFDTFFTTKPVGKGTGLGLSISYGIVAKHHGRIDVDSRICEGSRFRIVLPVRQPQATVEAG